MKDEFLCFFCGDSGYESGPLMRGPSSPEVIPMWKVGEAQWKGQRQKVTSSIIWCKLMKHLEISARHYRLTLRIINL